VLHSAPEGLTAFPVEAPGKVGEPRTLGEVARGDGMTVDEKGNLYLTQPREKCVLVLSPAGKNLGRITLPQSPSNCTFGGKDRRTLFVTARTSLYAVPMAVRGLPRR
jgi:gluconolactonase